MHLFHKQLLGLCGKKRASLRRDTLRDSGHRWCSHTHTHTHTHTERERERARARERESKKACESESESDRDTKRARDVPRRAIARQTLNGAPPQRGMKRPSSPGMKSISPSPTTISVSPAGVETRDRVRQRVCVRERASELDRQRQTNLARRRPPRHAPAARGCAPAAQSALAD